MFILSYAKRNALPLPAGEVNYRSDSLRTFQRVWHDLTPYILVMKSSSDLCQTCQEYSFKISNSGNLDEDEKGSLTNIALDAGIRAYLNYT
ncbi:hypothetical protein KUTeg_012054 [Tegillarca granosa]|uniref:Uncharacterized protein n=1 Tax=Tegillarca granosa TaxID=220873 RepID=A0ABQ9EYF6_TEGGR|nr:hypothetical protein KUTeg_012054 [Tegillarca granosa]